MSEKRQLNRLTLDLMLRLTDYMRSNYITSGLDDVDFAKKATEALGFPVEKSNVATAREALSLPSNYKLKSQETALNRATKRAEVKNAGGNVQILDELHAINKLLVQISKRMDTYFGSK